MNQQGGNERKTFFIIDGSSYIYRAFYAIRRLTNSKGMATHAVYGFFTMLLKVMRERKPDYICVVFDAPGRGFRQDMFEDYKATRQAMPEEMVPQIPYIKQVVTYSGVPRMELAGYEADDLIATLVHWGAARGLDIVIVSADKDLLQLVEDPTIRQWDPQNDRLFTAEVVKERFGVTPKQMIDYLGLVGDTSDNIPGVKGVGEKTARKLLETWESIDAIYENLDRISPESLRKKLEGGRESAYLSRELVKLRLDVVIERGIEEFAPAPPMKKEMLGLCEELDFKSLLETLKREWAVPEEARPSAAKPPSTRTDHIIRTREELLRLLPLLDGKSLVSVEIETTSQEAMGSEIVAIALCFEDNVAYYIPVGHRGPDSECPLTAGEALREIQPFLSASPPAKAGQDLKFQWVVLRCNGIELNGMAFDTMIASYLLDPGNQSHALDRVAAEYLDETISSLTELTGRGKARIGFAELDVARAAEYGCGDVESIWRLVPVLRQKLEESGLMKLFEQIELPLTEVLAHMEYRGILVDSAKLENLAIEFQKALDQKAGLIFEMAGEEFNIQSPKQLGYILFDKLGLSVVKKTKSGASTDMAVLEELAAEHPIADQVLVYRTLSKLKGTYADALPKLVRPKTGRIHTSFNQTVAATGRLSSSNPNLQNIPIRSEEGKKIREAFIAAPGNMLLSADYSQIELRVLAWYSGDRSLLEAFREGDDVHRRTAADVFGVGPADVTPEMRRQAKMINFGIIYGMSPFGLAQRLRISTKVARAAIDRYFERYSGVRRFIDEAVRKARELGYAETLLGRRRAIPELQSRNFTIRNLGERLAINTPIQGTAADLIKKAMIDIHRALMAGAFRTEMLLQVHDELLFEVPGSEMVRVQELIRNAMENVWEDLDVPIRIEMGWGSNWAEAHP
ncbi:MAG: DNA polymerase I [Syntrophobacteraceae bacterium]